jgi:UDP-N-acetylmuramoyl-tripeptide--D-alanyl-D-alanine ligase
MRPRSLAEVAAAMGGTVLAVDGGEVVVRGVAVDSRRVAPGDLFVALPGERSDGHAFLLDAFGRGAAAALVAAGRQVEADGPVIEVRDPAKALLDLARDERKEMHALVVGITGSTGKTCTKDLTAAVLAERYRVAASPASFNNEVGLPLTLLSAAEDTQAVVCEMGSRGPGHIRLLCEVARPSVGVVTNVGVAHMELFGSPEVLRDAKAELPEALPAEGTAVLNADDPVVRGFSERTEARTVLFGTSEDADVRASRIRMDRATGAASFDLVSVAGAAPVIMPVPGEHMVADALAAAAVGLAAGLSLQEAARGISGATLTGGRMEVVTAPGQLRLINDAYNANPASMAAALRSARWMAGDGRCIAVLGLMAELGPISTTEHERIGELVARLGIDALVVVGPEARLLAVGAEREGVEPDRIAVCEGPEEAARAVRRFAAPGSIVVVKGSRVARLERVVEALRQPAEQLEGAGT